MLGRCRKISSCDVLKSVDAAIRKKQKEIHKKKQRQAQNKRTFMRKTSQRNKGMGSGCGAVGRAVAYDTRGPGFESSHRQLLLNIYLLLTDFRKDENKEKRPGMAHL